MLLRYYQGVLSIKAYIRKHAGGVTACIPCTDAQCPELTKKEKGAGGEEKKEENTLLGLGNHFVVVRFVLTYTLTGEHRADIL